MKLGMRAMCAGVALIAALVAAALWAGPVDAEEETMPGKILGMYIHQHWAYGHPYAARTWTIADWTGYLDGISRLGYNMILIWPMLETMPDPLTESDRENLEKIRQVIDLAHGRHGMRVYIVLCPNVCARNEEAASYTFVERPFFHTDARVDPADAAAFGRLMAWREELLQSLGQADGLFVIDSDPGGYPGSTNIEFVYLLNAHRTILDRIRPGMELYYWHAFGWEGYARFYETGELVIPPIEEAQEAMRLLAKQAPEPWGLATAKGKEAAEPIGLGDRVLAFNYGAVEGEPSFPMTRFDDGFAYEGGRNGGARGVLGNSQTHCVQLPNLFAFARGAQGLPAEEADYIRFAEDLLPGHGEAIVAGWRALAGEDAEAMDAAKGRLAAVAAGTLAPGPLRGLLFGDGRRFLEDLVRQLDMAATMRRFHAAVHATPRDAALTAETFRAFVDAAAAWQARHDYRNHWYWPPMIEALRALQMPVLDETLDTLTWTADGETGMEKVQNGLSRLETYTPRLIAAMRTAAEELEAAQAEGGG